MSAASLFSGDADYSNVCAGTGASLYVDDPPARVGQAHFSGGGGNDGAWLAFLEFDTTAIVSTASAFLRVVIGENHADSGQSLSYNDVTVFVAAFDFATLDTGDWQDTAALAALITTGDITSVGPGPGDTVDIPLDPFDIVEGGLTRFVMYTDKQAAGTPADVGATNQDEWWSMSSAALFVNGDPVEAPPVDALAAPCVVATVGGWVADGATQDANGIAYTVQDADGWWSLPIRSAMQEQQPRGETPTVAHELGRAVTLTIVAHNPGGQIGLGAPAAFAAIEAIKAAFRCIFVPVLLEITDPSTTPTPLAALVRRVGPIKQQILGASTAVKFTVPLLAENPVLV